MTGIQLTLNRKTSRFIQALWYNIRVEREYLEVSLTGPKVWPVFGLCQSAKLPGPLRFYGIMFARLRTLGSFAHRPESTAGVWQSQTAKHPGLWYNKRK